MTEGNGDNSEPVTIVTTHFVRPERMKEFEKELKSVSKYFTGYPGYLGVNFFRPADPADGDFRVVLKFSSADDYERWTESEERKRWKEKEKELTIAPPKRYRVNGLETWFTLPGNNILKPPPRHRQYFVTWLAVWPVIAVLGPIEGFFFKDLPYILQKMIDVAILAFLLTYIVMPFMTKVFRQFLYPDEMEKKMDTEQW